MIVYVSLLVAILGGLMFWFGGPKTSKAGEILLLSGSLAFLLQIGGSQVGLMSGRS